MKTTRKLSGPAKDRFFRRFYAEDAALTPDLAERLAQRSSSAFSSVRIRRDVFKLARIAPQRPVQTAPTPKKSLPGAEPEDAAAKGDRVVPARVARPPARAPSAPSRPSPQAPVSAAGTIAPAAQPAARPQHPETVASPLPAQTDSPPPPEAIAEPETAPAATAPFDPFCIGLVPTLQREGRAGLAAKLAGISSVGDLRAMAKAQQIVLPRDLRTGDAEPETIREAIVTAVARRVEDRRSAAG